MIPKQQLLKMLRSKRFLSLIAVFVVLAILPVILSFVIKESLQSLILNILTPIAFFAIYASSWNFLANSGQGSLGHALFLGVGGFSSAIMGSSISRAAASLMGSTQLPVGPLSVIVQILAIIGGGLLSAAIGLAIGLACVRLKAWYLAMVTFGFSVIAATISAELDAITQGKNGFSTITLVPKGLPFYVLTLSFAVGSILVMYLITNSKTGMAFKAIHENEAEAKMIGINTAKYKLIAFVISTFFAGISGGLYAYYFRLIDNSVYAAANSFSPLMMTVIGGLGTVAGPVIGAIFMVSIQQFLAFPSVVDFLRNTMGGFFPEVSNVGGPLGFLIIGVILLVIVIFSPKGLEPQIRKLYKHVSNALQEKEVKKK
jgi:branched-chain amino acid transport system permease protein